MILKRLFFVFFSVSLLAFSACASSPEEPVVQTVEPQPQKASVVMMPDDYARHVAIRTGGRVRVFPLDTPVAEDDLVMSMSADGTSYGTLEADGGTVSVYSDQVTVYGFGEDAAAPQAPAVQYSPYTP